ncbi:MAG: CRTAC1 family protein, partial [Flavobacteriales bacterium]|nr:CRTAC1 family protein [Flavobacteriales bacterium]
YGVLFTQHVGGFLGHGVSFADFNDDGFDDLCFAQFEGEIFAYQGDGEGGFASIDLGLGNTNGEPKSVLWADFDNDGDQDLLITQRLAENRLYARMPSGSLQEVPSAGGVAGTNLERTYGAAVADFDKDDRLDIYLCNYHSPQTNSEENHLFRSIGGVDLAMQFEEVTSLAGVGNGVKQSFQATWIDIDRDGWLDLHVINDRTFWPDAMYRNQGDGTFVDMAANWGIDIGEYSMSSTFADFDKDHDWDIVVANGASDGNNFLMCMGHPFQESNGETPVLNYVNVASDANIFLDRLAWGALFFDADNNGWLDLFIGTGTSFYTDFPSILDVYDDNLNGFFLNNGGTFPLEAAPENVYTDNELTFSSAFADHNRDGAMDFVSHRIGARARLLNGVPNGNHWAQVTLEPSSGNRDAIGAVVTAWQGGVGDMRTVTCGSEYLNQNSRRLHFGFGDSPLVDSLTVDWPSGNHTLFANPAVDVVHHLMENDGNGGVLTFGCTYPVACNFLPSAEVDNGSCDFACACGEGTVWDNIAMKCVAQCTADQDGDGQIGTGDLILFLTFFGDTCE